MKQSTALYAGSFDPLTNGHYALILRASRTFGHVVVGVINNPQKSPMFTAEERVDMIRRIVADLPNVEVEHFTGLLADYVNERGFSAVLRGLRSGGDFENEINMAQMNARLYKGDVETVFLYPWAVVVQKFGVMALVSIGFFLLVLVFGLAYAWRKGALEWK